MMDPENLETPAEETLSPEASEMAVIDAVLAESQPEPVPEFEPEPEAPVSDEIAEPAADAVAEPEPEPVVDTDPVSAEMADLGVTNEKSQKRFRELASKAAEADELKKFKPAAESWNQLETFLGEAKATPEQFGAAVGFLKMVNSDDPVLLGQAYEVMKGELQALGKRLGREAPGYDPLADDRELSEQIESGIIGRDQASELARLRREQALHAERNTKANQELQQQQEREQWVNRGREDLNTLEAELRALDPSYASKREMLIPVLKPIIANMHPSQWAASFKQAYINLPAQAPAPPAPRPAAGVSHQPIRPVGASNPGLIREPKTEMEVIEYAIQMANARQR